MVHVYIPEQYLICHPTIDRWSLIRIASLTDTCKHLDWGANHLGVVNNQKWPSPSRIITFVMALSINGTPKSTVLRAPRTWKISCHWLTRKRSRIKTTTNGYIIWSSSNSPCQTNVSTCRWVFPNQRSTDGPTCQQSPSAKLSPSRLSGLGSFIGVRFTCSSSGLAQLGRLLSWVLGLGADHGLLPTSGNQGWLESPMKEQPWQSSNKTTWMIYGGFLRKP